LGQVFVFCLMPAYQCSAGRLSISLLLEVGATKGGKKISEAAVGFTIDAALQMLIAYYFELDEADRSWDKAMEMIDPWQAGASGVEAMLNNSLASAGISCLQDGTFKEGEFRESFELRECLKGALSSLIIDGALNAGPAYRKLKTLAEQKPDRFLQGVFLMMDSRLSKGMTKLTDIVRFCEYFGIPEEKVLQYIKRTDAFIEGWYTSAENKYKKLYGQQFNNITEAAGVWAFYGSAWVVKKLKSGTSFERLADKAYFDELLAKLPSDKQIDFNKLKKEDYDELLSVFNLIKKQHTSKKIEDLADNFDKLTNYYTPQQLKPWLQKGVDAYKLQHVFESLLVDATSGKKTQVLAMLGDWEAPTINSFSDDLANSVLVLRFKKDLNFITSWKIMYLALGRNSQFTKDISTLEKITALSKENSGFRAKLGNNWSEALDEILKNSKDLKCHNCTGGRIGRSEMHQFLGDAEHFIINFEIKPGGKGEVFYNWMRGASNPTSGQLDELHQTLRDFAKRQITESDVQSLGKQFPIGNKKYDLRRIGDKYTEYKNKNFVSKPLTAGSDDADQLINGYLRNIKSFDDLEWKAGYDKLKDAWGTSENALFEIKKQWKKVFEQKSNEVFESNPSLFNKFRLEDGTLVTDSELFSEFLEEINETHQLFNFIKVE
jgi:hypothetical protein